MDISNITDSQDLVFIGTAAVFVEFVILFLTILDLSLHLASSHLMIGMSVSVFLLLPQIFLVQ